MKFLFSLIFRILAVACLACGCFPRAASAAEPTAPYEYSPYEVRVWIGFARKPELTERLMDSVITAIEQRADALAHAAWRLEASAAPAAKRSSIVSSLGDMRYEDLVTVDEASPSEIDEVDKLILVAVDIVRGEFVVQARELDIRTRYLGPITTMRAKDIALLPGIAYRAVAWAFSPVGAVHQAAGTKATLKIRAIGLVLRPENPAAVDIGSVFVPIIRRNNRYGQPVENGIRVAEWTYMVANERVRMRLKCKVHSGVRSPISGRSGRRTEKLGLLLRPPKGSTQLRLIDRKAPHGPLSGYDIYEKLPDDQKPLYIGRTDWRGLVEIGPGATTLRVLYVRNGSHLLARLPVAPGAVATVEAKVPNDDSRLGVEGFVSGLRTSIMDLVAQREVLAVRIRKEIASSKLEEARKLFEELRALPSADDISRRLEQQGSAQRRKAADARSKTKIDELFNQTRLLITKYLRGNLNATLNAEILAAQRAK